MKKVLLIASIILFLPAPLQAQWTFDKPKEEKPLPNPYKVNLKRDIAVGAALQVLERMDFALNDQASKVREGKLITEKKVFIKGYNAQNQLKHFADVPASEVRNWTRGRVEITVTVEPIDPNNSQIAVAADFEGYVQDALGSEWVKTPSKGILEDEILRAILERLDRSPSPVKK